MPVSSSKKHFFRLFIFEPNPGPARRPSSQYRNACQKPQNTRQKEKQALRRQEKRQPHAQTLRELSQSATGSGTGNARTRGAIGRQPTAAPRRDASLPIQNEGRRTPQTLLKRTSTQPTIFAPATRPRLRVRADRVSSSLFSILLFYPRQPPHLLHITSY